MLHMIFTFLFVYACVPFTRGEANLSQHADVSCALHCHERRVRLLRGLDRCASLRFRWPLAEPLLPGTTHDTCTCERSTQEFCQEASLGS